MSNPRTDPVYKMVKPWQGEFLEITKAMINREFERMKKALFPYPAPNFPKGGEGPAVGEYMQAPTDEPKKSKWEQRLAEMRERQYEKRRQEDEDLFKKSSNNIEP
jgi:hypothetical protein